MITSFKEIIAIAKKVEGKKISVAAAHHNDVIKAVIEAKNHGIATAILVGDKDKILEISNENNYDLSDFEIIDVKDPKEAAAVAVGLVKDQKADILMKGKVQTPDLMKCVLNKENGIRTNEVLTHVAVYKAPAYKKLVFITDGGVNISPDLNKKVSIINNAVSFAIGLGIETPKVAVLAAIELVNQDMEATLDAALLSKMQQRGQIKNCLIDGPLALDNAVNHEAAEIKGITSSVAGDADILLVPNIEVGNVMAKALTYLAGAETGGLVLGAQKPIVLVSRADSYSTKLNSIALSVAMLKDNK